MVTCAPKSFKSKLRGIQWLSSSKITNQYSSCQHIDGWIERDTRELWQAYKG